MSIFEFPRERVFNGGNEIPEKGVARLFILQVEEDCRAENAEHFPEGFLIINAEVQVARSSVFGFRIMNHFQPHSDRGHLNSGIVGARTKEQSRS